MASTCCGICLEDMNADTILQAQPCEHVFCTDCLRQYARGSTICPDCNKQIERISAVSSWVKRVFELEKELSTIQEHQKQKQQHEQLIARQLQLEESASENEEQEQEREEEEDRSQDQNIQYFESFTMASTNNNNNTDQEQKFLNSILDGKQKSNCSTVLILPQKHQEPMQVIDADGKSWLISPVDLNLLCIRRKPTYSTEDAEKLQAFIEEKKAKRRRKREERDEAEKIALPA